MKTEHALADALRELMSKEPLDNISVTSLTAKCNVSRKTFYYHFHDIYDLLTLVFLDEKIYGIETCKDIQSLIKTIYKYYENNKFFIDATINCSAKDLFVEFIYNIIYKNFLKYINEYLPCKQLHLNEKKAIVRYYSFAYTNSLIYYLENYKNKSFEGLMSNFSFVDNKCLFNAVDKTIKARSK